MNSGNGAIFLDRDGTINQMIPCQYVVSMWDFHFIEGALEALVELAQQSERKIVVVTNQSPIGRGYAARAEVDAVHGYMTEHVERAGGRIDAIYVCPHAPWEGCACRKPAPGLFHQAIRDLDLDPEQCCLVGDTKHDLMAAWAAGIRDCYLVLTGKPLENFLPESSNNTYAVYASLADAAKAILRGERDD